MTEQLPPDPFGPPDDLLNMMKGISQLYSAAVMSGLPEGVATSFITGVFVSLVQGMQGAQSAEE